MAITYLSGERIQGSSTATEQLDYETVRDDSNDASSLDLTGSTISDSSWVLRFKLKPTTVTQTSSSDSVPLLIGISSLPSSSHHSSSHDFLGIQPRITGSYSNYYVMAVDGGTLDNVPSEVFSHALQVETIYVEMIRNGNTFSVELFSDEYSTSIESETKSCTSIANLRYFWIGNMNIGAGATPPHINIGEIHDLKFYNGVTSASGTPTTSDDFSSDNMVDQDTAKIGVGATSAVDEKATLQTAAVWTKTGTGTNITGGIVEIRNPVANDDSITYPLGLTVDGNFVLRFKFRQNSGSGGNGETITLTNNVSINDATERVGIQLGNQWFYINAHTGGAVIQSSGGTSNGADYDVQTLTSGTWYYGELKRAGNVYSVTFRTGSHSGTQFGNVLGFTKTSGNHTSATMILIGAFADSGAKTSDVDDVEFWDDTTSTSGTPTYTQNFSTAVDSPSSDIPTGTRFEETDTRKIFRMKAGDWVEKGTA